jgi:small-conductance mechanosensitive channel
MSLFRKDWTPAEADDWGINDWIAVIVSPVIYVLILIGGALSMLLIPAGFVLLGIGIVLLVVLLRVIDPKLAAVSRGYEEKQKHYIEELERKVKWED